MFENNLSEIGLSYVARRCARSRLCRRHHCRSFRWLCLLVAAHGSSYLFIKSTVVRTCNVTVLQCFILALRFVFSFLHYVSLFVFMVSFAPLSASLSLSVWILWFQWVCTIRGETVPNRRTNGALSVNFVRKIWSMRFCQRKWKNNKQQLLIIIMNNRIHFSSCRGRHETIAPCTQHKVEYDLHLCYDCGLS